MIPDIISLRYVNFVFHFLSILGAQKLELQIANIKL